MRLYHGGQPGLRVGDVITPGVQRPAHPGCAICAARAAGVDSGIDAPAARVDRVYATTSRLYAAHYASLYGRGDLYRVDTIGEVDPSFEDTIESYAAAGLVVVAVLDRAVTLTPTERRRLWREWGEADRKHAAPARPATWAARGRQPQPTRTIEGEQ